MFYDSEIANQDEADLSFLQSKFKPYKKQVGTKSRESFYPTLDFHLSLGRSVERVSQ